MLSCILCIKPSVVPRAGCWKHWSFVVGVVFLVFWVFFASFCFFLLCTPQWPKSMISGGGCKRAGLGVLYAGC